MTLNQVTDILNTHIFCIKRQNTPFCNKNCKNCNVYVPYNNLIEASELSVKILTKIKEIKNEVK